MKFKDSVLQDSEFVNDTEDNFTFYKQPDWDENAPTVPEGNFL